MMKKKHILKAAVAGIVILFICGCLQPSLASISKTITPSLPTKGDTITDTSTAEITCFIIGMQGKQSKQKITIPTTEAEWFRTQLQTLSYELSVNPQSEKTQQLQYELITFSDTHDLLPADVSVYSLQSQLKRAPTSPLNHIAASPLIQGTASEWFCNFATFGEGSAFPIIILPRLIPFLLMPIPRAFVWWSTPEGLTSVGGLISRTGFLAGGQQKGIALGFWGIGFSIFLPPIMSYGILGYALYTRVTAEEFQFYPPNNPPEITQTDPADGQQMVPISTTELRFEINDANGDLMSYNVTTEPDIGSGSGGLKPDGTYSIPISGLEDLTKYTWYVEVTDGKDTTEKTMTFTTEAIAPIISNPIPADGERDVPMDISQLQFTLKDYQGDTMEYTVQTSPNIGSDHKVGVHDGTYTVTVSGLMYGATYRWYVNATDGTHWTRKIFSFETGYPSQFDPFEFGWHYRKQITIDHSKVAGNLTNFPVLVSTVDVDLSQKTQDDGDDILFMNAPGVATRLNYEIEQFDANSGKLVAWVNITTLSSNDDTTFYMYYGNPTCLTQQYPEKTWDSNYVGVWHSNDLTTSTIKDSTSHSYTGTKKAVNEPVVTTSGKIGNAQSFDGSNDYISCGNLHQTKITISFWAKHNNAARSLDGGISKGWLFGSQPTIEWQFCFHAGAIVFEFKGTDGTGHGTSYNVIDAGIWTQWVGTYDGQTITMYKNGASVGTPLSTTATVQDLGSSYPFGIGGRLSGQYAIDGMMDEVQYSSIARSSAWISTEFNNQNNPTSFLSFGSEEPGP